MSKISDRYLEPGKAYNHTEMRMPDVRHGGMFGYAPNLSEIISTTPNIPRDMIVLITRYPGMFDLIEDGPIWKEALKYMVEVHPKAITGFDATITLGTSDVQISPSGATIRPVNDATISHSKLNMIYPMDFQNEPIVTFWKEFIRMGIRDPILKRPLISTMDIKRLPDDWTLDMYSWDLIGFEPNVHFTKVVKAWEVYGVHPLGSGPITGSKDPLNPRSIEDLTYELTGVDESDIGTRVAAQAILDKINITKANPYTVKSQLTDTEIGAIAESKEGYFRTLQDVKDNQLTDEDSTGL